MDPCSGDGSERCSTGFISIPNSGPILLDHEIYFGHTGLQILAVGHMPSEGTARELHGEAAVTVTWVPRSIPQLSGRAT